MQREPETKCDSTESAVHAYDWTTYQDEGNVNISCWTLDKDVKPYLLKVNNFEISDKT